MKNSLIFSITNDDITIAAGKYFKGKPVLLNVKTRKYDGLLDSSIKPVETTYLVKEIRSILDEMFDKIPYFDEVYVVIPDLKIDTYLSSITVYTDNSSSIVTEDDIKRLFLSATKKTIGDQTNKIIDVSPIYFETDKQQFTKPPIGEHSSSLKMSYGCYPISANFYKSFEKLFNKLGFKDFKLTFNSVEIANLIKATPNSPKSYFLLDSGYTNSYFSIVGSHVVYYNQKLAFNIFNLLEDFVHEYDIPYSDVRQIINTYGYDNSKHPIKVLLYEGKNSFDVDVKIYQHDVNKKIDEFIEKFAKDLLEKEIMLKNIAKLSSDIDVPFIGIGEIFAINGFKQKLESVLGKKINVYQNKFTYHNTRNIYPILGSLCKIEEYDLKKTVASENISNVTRGD